MFRNVIAIVRHTATWLRARRQFSEAIKHRNRGRHAEALHVAEQATNLYRDVVATKSTALQVVLAESHIQGINLSEAARRDLAGSLNNLGIWLGEAGRRAEALQAAQEAVELSRELAAANRRAFLPGLALSLNNLGTSLREAGRRDEALHAAREALELYRELAAANQEAFLPDLAMSLHNLGITLGEAGRRDEALQAAQEAVELYSELAAVNRGAFLPRLTASVNSLGVRLSEAGHRAEALEATQEATILYRELVAANPEAVLPDLAESLNNLGLRLNEAGRRAEALEASQEAVDLFRELAAGNRGAFRPRLAKSLNTLGRTLSGVGRRAEALRAAQEATDLNRELVTANPEAVLPELAGSVNNLGNLLGDVGRRAEALEAAQEAVGLYRELAAANRAAFLPDLAMSLNNLGNMLSDVGRRAEALQAAQDAVELYRELAAANRGAFLPDLAVSLNNLGIWLSEAGRGDEALQAAQEALELRRELAAANWDAFLPGLAGSLNNLGIWLSEAGRGDEALQAAQEAVELYRELAAANREVFLPDLAMSLDNLGATHSEAGRHAEAQQAHREGGMYLFESSPMDPYLWTRLARGPTQNLDTAQDLRDWHLPLLRQLTEHRELAFDTGHGALFLELQGSVASRVWELLGTLATANAELVDEAVAVLVSTLHSPDLARWLQAQGTGDGATAALARFKRDVIEADQVLQILMQQLRGGDAGASGGQRSGGTDPALNKELAQRIDEQAAKARTLREAFRTERQRLIESDPKFRSAFELPSIQALRETARHGDGSALLCLLDLRRGDVSTDDKAERSPDQHRIVGALLHADGRRTGLLEFAEVNQLAWHASEHRPEGTATRHHGPLRGAPAPASSSSESPELPVEPELPPITDLLAPRMSSAFWSPLQRAVQEAGLPIERLHLCTHGLTQQLPPALRDAQDLPGVQVMAWPGLPYLRLAATAASPDAAATAPWLVGHDCAWDSEQPLPMVAVEAALLRQLLKQHGQPVQAVEQGAQVRGDAAALVTCCHGGAEQAQFDHALHLGSEPLTVRQILQEHLGPPLALLPACHAGRTDEDTAGNALGVAAAFMLSGTKVVAASSKAVPDLLQPWLSTLTVWHAMQGLPHHEAATRARTQFAKLEFPDGYRQWLQAALPQALATIQPGGEEDRLIRGARAQLELESVAECWPWEGQTQHLFSADRRKRDEATRSVVQGILRPRGDEAGARALAAEAREMAAFVFVYGIG